MNVQKTPNANRIHIGIFGKVNSGKSTLLNAITSQKMAVVSKEAGTTTDPVYKAMEMPGLGAVTFIDTAGYADSSVLGKERLVQTKRVAKKVDIAIIICRTLDVEEEKQWLAYFKQQQCKTLIVVNAMLNDAKAIISQFPKENKDSLVVANVTVKKEIESIKKALTNMLPEDLEVSITGNVVKERDIVMLVMPQDSQAPKGRLILPQVQTIRELLDKQCMVINCTTSTIDTTLQALYKAPDVIICDSQVFDIVYEKTPKESKLTSFSVLFAGYKGDIQSFIEGGEAISSLTENSHVLIAEACTHAPATEDIGTVKIPALLRKKVGKHLQVSVVSGGDFPKDISRYDLIIHCGACMFNRRYMLSRIAEAKQQGIPITNYGITIAYLQGILDKISM